MTGTNEEATASAVIEALLTVVRHGETDHNLKRLLQGQTDIPLNATGRRQAELGGVAVKGQKFDLVISSDLSRAFQTASNIVSGNDHNKDVGCIEKDVLIRERSFGVFEDKPIQDCCEAATAAGKKSFYEFVPEGAESEAQVQMRSDKFFKTMLERLANKHESGSKVLVVSHGGWIRHLMTHLAGTGKITGIPKDLVHTCCPNVGISQFNLVVNKKTGKLVNGTCLAFYSKDHLSNSFNG